MEKISCEWKEVLVKEGPPNSRTGHSIVKSKDVVYLFGGFQTKSPPDKIEKSDHYLNDLWKLSLKDLEFKWTQYQYTDEEPIPREAHVIILDGKCIYIFGGRNDSNSRYCLTEINKLLIDEDDVSSCEKIPSKGQHPKAIGFSANKVGRKVFTFGGLISGHPTNHLFMFNLDELSWTPLRSPEMRARCDHSSVAVGSNIYIFGGASSADIFFNDLWRFDTNQMIWEEIIGRGLSMSPRAGHVLLAHRDKDLYLFGGLQNDHQPINSFNKFSLKTSKWKRMIVAGKTQLTESLHGHCSFIHHSCLYFIGGIQLAGEVCMSKMTLLKLINPSERRNVFEHYSSKFTESVLKQEIVFTQNIYKAQNAISVKIDEFVCDKKDQLMDLSPESTNSLSKIKQGNDHLAICSRKIADCLQQLEDEKSCWMKLLESQRQNAIKLVEYHQQSLDKRRENYMKELKDEKQKINIEWEKVAAEKKKLDEENKKLEEKIMSLGIILEQLL